jgi:hypothetical protein
MPDHTWIKHTMTPVSVLTDDEGDPIVFVDPDQQTIAEDTAAYGCSTCGQPMVNNVHTQCEGPSDEED